MLNYWVEFAINILVGVLRAIVKNPAQYAGMLKVLQDVDADLQEAIAALEALPPLTGAANPTAPAPQAIKNK